MMLRRVINVQKRITVRDIRQGLLPIEDIKVVNALDAPIFGCVFNESDVSFMGQSIHTAKYAKTLIYLCSFNS